MSILKPFKIIGHGVALPTQKVSSEALEQQLGISKGWAYKYSGVKNRYNVTTETNAILGAIAARKALEKNNLKFTDIDLLISASATFDQPLPHQSSLLKRELDPNDLSSLPCMDIGSSCLSFVTALDVAARYLDGKTYRNILIVSAEIASKGLNPNDAKTATLFGDAAAAIIVAYDEKGESGLIKYQQKTYSKGVHGASVKGGGNKYFFKDHPYDPELHSFQMNSKPLLRMGMLHVPPFVATFFEDLPLTIKDIDVIIPHQASKIALKIFKKQFNLTNPQVFENLAQQGNCIAASIPTALSQALTLGQLQKGQTCLLMGTSAGFGIGALMFKV